jgi:(2Fe-2S) ferredoxin
MKKIANRAELEEAGKQGRTSLYPSKTKLAVGTATCGIASGAEAVFRALSEESRSRGLDALVVRTGCIGFCQQEPLVDVLEPGKPRITYGQMTAKKARELVGKLANGDGLPREGAVYRTEDDELVVTDQIVSFFSGETANGFGKIPLFQQAEKDHSAQLRAH